MNANDNRKINVLLCGIVVVILCCSSISFARVIDRQSNFETCTPLVNAVVIDSPYWSQHWRDSANEYQARLFRYRQEVIDYDQAFLFSWVPLAAESNYTGQVAKGAVFFFARAVSGIAVLDGILGITRGQGSTLQNVIFVIAGVVGYIFFKVTEMDDVQHDVSSVNESLVSKWHIATDDIDSSSIRYPKEHWPDWVTSRPVARAPQSPQPTIQSMQSPANALGLNVNIPF